MAIPPFEVFLRPTLAIVADRGSIDQPRHAVLAPVAKALGLSAEECEERLESGGSRLASRCGWALTYLRKAGLISFPRRGYAEITEEGREFLGQHPKSIGIAELDQIPRFLEFRGLKEKDSSESEDEVPISAVRTSATPDERIEQAVGEIRQALASELLSVLRTCSPRFFEQVVLKLIRSMGYGTSEQSIKHTGGSGDFGIDGVISLDLLGFDKVCLQAKRWQGKVNHGVLREFYGALEYQRANKGVILTTSSFAADAQDFCDRAEKRIVLIDGQRLCELMVEHGIGVESTSVKVPKIDENFFKHAAAGSQG